MGEKEFMRHGDEELIGKLWKDLDAYFHLCYLKYWRPVFAFVYSRLLHPQDAEDVAMLVFERAYQDIKRRISTGDKRELNLKTWLFKIALRECIRFKKRFHQSSESLDDPDVLTGFESTPNGQDISAEERAQMIESDDETWIILFQLPDHERCVLALYYFFEMRCGEIADVLTMNPNTVKSHLRRGRQRLKELIKKREQIIKEAVVIKISQRVFGSDEIGVLASEHKSTTDSNTSKTSAQSSDSAVKESHDYAVHSKESHHDANQTCS